MSSSLYDFLDSLESFGQVRQSDEVDVACSEVFLPYQLSTNSEHEPEENSWAGIPGVDSLIPSDPLQVSEPNESTVKHEQCDALNGESNRSNTTETEPNRRSSVGKKKCDLSDAEKKRQYVAAASRKTRLKRKLEKQGLISRNEDLEKEQKSFRKTIAELQSEIQNLKHAQCSNGSIDLKTENLLLRAEVKRHKTFLNHIKFLMDDVPEFTTEERLQLANHGIESAIGQVLGMCHTSVVDKSWKELSYDFALEVPNTQKIKVVLRYQFLPLGSTPENALRVNVRQDISAIPIDIDFLKQHMTLRREKMEQEFAYAFAELSFSPVDFEIQEIDMAMSKMSVKEDQQDYNQVRLGRNAVLSEGLKKSLTPLQVFRYTEKFRNGNEKPIEYYIMKGYSDKMVKSFGFPPIESDAESSSSSDTPAAEEKAYIVVHTIAPTKLHPLINRKTDEFERKFFILLISCFKPIAGYDDPYLDGWVLRPTPDGKGTQFTGAASYPLDCGENRRLPMLVRNKLRKIRDLRAIEEYSKTRNRMPAAVRMETKLMQLTLGKLMMEHKQLSTSKSSTSSSI